MAGFADLPQLFAGFERLMLESLDVESFELFAQPPNQDILLSTSRFLQLGTGPWIGN